MSGENVMSSEYKVNMLGENIMSSEYKVKYVR